MDWRSKNNATLGKTTEHSGWLENMNRAVTFLEESLTGAVDVEHAAQIACCSSYHFQRIFSFLAGVPLLEYVRRRRLTLAAFDLQAGKRVLEVALDYGYDYMIGYHCSGTGSPEGFTMLEIPSANWAVFSTAQLSLAEAGREIQLLWSRVFTEWFPTSGYELADAPELEMHYRTGSELYRNEIWIPVKR